MKHHKTMRRILNLRLCGSGILLNVVLLKTEKGIFSLISKREKVYNLTNDWYLVMSSLENDRNFITKSADKGSTIVVWDRLDYLAEAEKQLSDSSTYKDVKLSEKDQVILVKRNNIMFERLKNDGSVTC